MEAFWYGQAWYTLQWIESDKNSTTAHIAKWMNDTDAKEKPDESLELLAYSFSTDNSNLFEEIGQKLTAEDGPFANATSEKPLDPIDEMQNLLDEVTSILTDEQADQIPQAFSEWKTGITYSVGQRVRYNNELWRCVQAHTSQEGWEPSATPSLWTRTHQEGEIPEWTQPLGATDAYSIGDKVKYSDKIWESTVDNNVWEPGVYGWTEVTDTE